MAWNRPTQKIENESKAVKGARVWWGLGARLIVAVAAVAGVVLFTAGAGRPRPLKTAAGEEIAEETPMPKQSRTMRVVAPAAAPAYNVVRRNFRGASS